MFLGQRDVSAPECWKIGPSATLSEEQRLLMLSKDEEIEAELSVTHQFGGYI